MNSLGIMYTRYGIIDRARQLFLDAIDRENLPRAWENMGNLSYMEGDFQAALFYYRNAREKGEDAPELLLPIARVQYELGDFDQAGELFGIVSRTAPELIAGNAYLESENSPGRAAGFRPEVFRWSE